MDPKELAGYRWIENGQSAISGDLLDLYQRLDHLFLNWAADEGAAEHLFPPFPAADLEKIDYFRSFPHLATFPATLESGNENLERFTRQPTANGEVLVTDLGPIRDVLAPAACYHFYPHFQGQALKGAQFLTTRNTCFRRETHYVPLERQWSFSMREIVCIGSSDDVKAFLDRSQQRVATFLSRIALSVSWDVATDPFFRPSRSPKYLMQKLDPVKTEMVFENRLAIGSVNFHRNYFGEAFDIQCGGEAAFSGCVAFGVERWIAAWLSTFGPQSGDWPALP